MAIRKKLRLSQVGFARRFGFSPRSVQAWDQGRRKPESAARAYLLWSLRESRRRWTERCVEPRRRYLGKTDQVRLRLTAYAAGTAA